MTPNGNGSQQPISREDYCTHIEKIILTGVNNTKYHNYGFGFCGITVLKGKGDRSDAQKLIEKAQMTLQNYGYSVVGDRTIVIDPLPDDMYLLLISEWYLTHRACLEAYTYMAPAFYEAGMHLLEPVILRFGYINYFEKDGTAY